MRVEMISADCERCGKHADRLLPFVLSDSISYRGKTINKAWLCLKCFGIEKEKWWKANAE